MKFVHMADLHIGRRFGNTDWIDDQRFALNDALASIRQIRPDAVFLCGDLYDRSVPSVEAVRLADYFLTALVDTGAAVFAIGGNHDSQERLDFARALLAPQGLYLSGAYDGNMKKVTLSDAGGEVDIWMLPYLRPREAEAFFDDTRFESADDAVRAVLARENVDPARRNVLMAHQFVIGRGDSPELSDSEIHPVGGLGEVDASVFDGFCYVALGHLHGPQRAGRDAVRYAGSLMKYSFSETRHKKSFVSGEILPDGNVTYTLIPIRAPHDMRKIRGALDALTDPATVSSADAEDYICAVLTDPAPPASPMERLTSVYPNLLQIEFANMARDDAVAPAGEDVPPDDLTLFERFWRQMTGGELTEELRAVASAALNAAKEKLI